MSKKKEISRRAFLTEVAAGSAAITIVPRSVLGRGFTPPSDTLNIAAVGVGGMGRANLINLASQNIVALCDVDWRYADKGFDHLDIDIERLKKRIELPAPAQPGESSAPFDPVKAQARIDGMLKLKSTHLPKSRTLHRLSRNARPPERHRRRRRRHTRPHARVYRFGCYGSRQTCLRSEAALLVDRRSSQAFAPRKGNQSRHPNGATKVAPPTMAAPPSNTSGREPSAMSAKSTSGPIAP